VVSEQQKDKLFQNMLSVYGSPESSTAVVWVKAAASRDGRQLLL